MRSALTRPQATRNVIHVGSPETTSMPRRQSSVLKAVAAMSATSRGSTGAVKHANTCARSAVTTSAVGERRRQQDHADARAQPVQFVDQRHGAFDRPCRVGDDDVERPDAGVLEHLERAAARVHRMALQRGALAQRLGKALIRSDDQDSTHQFVHPPSTIETVPVVKADSSDAR